MDYKDFLGNSEEKPLDQIKEDGGFTVGSYIDYIVRHVLLEQQQIKSVGAQLTAKSLKQKFCYGTIQETERKIVFDLS